MTSIGAPATQLRDEDDAARMRAAGIPWSAIAHELAVTVHVAKAYVTASDRRAAQRAAEYQGALFDL
jgi:hypothetical protein